MSKNQKSKPKLRLWKAAIPISAAALIVGLMLHASGTGVYPGDVNCDKELDVSDAVIIARFCAEDRDIAISESGMENADVNGDKEINGLDQTMLLRQIAKQIPMPPNPYLATTAPEPETTTATESGTTAAATSSATSTSLTTTQSTTRAETASAEPKTQNIQTETQTVTTEAKPEDTAPPADQMTADKTPHPLGVSISVLSSQHEPNETLTVQYGSGNIIFAIFADDPRNTTIAVAYQDDIVGYYRTCREYTFPEGYSVKEYRDKKENTEDNLYAVLVLREDVSIDFDKLADPEGFAVLSKLNYYAVNGVRAVKDLEPFQWHPELAKIAEAHSRDMAEHCFFEHNSSDGTSRKDRMLNAGIDYMTGGENIDAGYRNTFDTVDGWLSSDEHRKNLLSTAFTHIGVGFAWNPDAPDQYYGTQDFCSFFPD